MGNDNCSEASISEILLKWYMYHLDFAYTYKFHKSPITSLAADWTVSCIKADQKNPAKADDPEIYESRHQPRHTWATFFSTISKAAPSVTCRSKTNSNFRLSTLQHTWWGTQHTSTAAKYRWDLVTGQRLVYTARGLRVITGWLECTVVQ